MQILGGAAMLLFGGKRKGGATILAAKVYLAEFLLGKFWREAQINHDHFREAANAAFWSPFWLHSNLQFHLVLSLMKHMIVCKLQTDVTSCVLQ